MDTLDDLRRVVRRVDPGRPGRSRPEPLEALVGGAGQAEGDRFVVRQFFMRDLNEEPALLAALAPLVARADGLVTYNGSGFDVPLLETRFVLARRRWPDLWHLDLLAPARRVW